MSEIYIYIFIIIIFIILFLAIFYRNNNDVDKSQKIPLLKYNRMNKREYIMDDNILKKILNDNNI